MRRDAKRQPSWRRKHKNPSKNRDFFLHDGFLKCRALTAIFVSCSEQIDLTGDENSGTIRCFIRDIVIDDEELINRMCDTDLVKYIKTSSES